MTVLDEIAVKIIKEQEDLVGPFAWSAAGTVKGIIVDQPKGSVHIENGDPKAAIDRLVSYYEFLFGSASHDVCKSAAADMLKGMSKEDIPTSLQ